MADGLAGAGGFRVGEADEGFGASGVVAAGLDGVLFFGAGAFVRAGAFVAFFEVVADGFSVGFLVGEAEGDLDGAAERPEPRSASADAEAEVRAVGSADDSPWVSRSGAPPAWTWSAAPPPLTL